MRVMHRTIRSLGIVLLLGAATPRLAAGRCTGDCDTNGSVNVNELVMAIAIAVDGMAVENCMAADPSGDRRVTVDELVEAVGVALKGCNCTGDNTAFASTFEAIQKVVFEKRGCTQQICHGNSVSPQGGLDLSPAVAYENLLEVPSTQVALDRIDPGNNDRSYLWLKLAASANPALLPPGFEIAGAPMPNGLPPISTDELEALRLWIYAGAPETGTVSGTEELLDACLPAPAPITIKPLDPPPPGEGVQFEMPPWTLEAESEREICFATYYDITDQVPEQYRDPTGTMFRFRASELRQDPQSHHLILYRYSRAATSIGPWRCRGGALDGQPCQPTDLASCGEGACATPILDTFACTNFGFNPAIGGAQQAQAYNEFLPGVFAEVPMQGVLLWNSHAFNLTTQDATMHARLNYYFAAEQDRPVHGIFNTEQIFAANAPPYTTQTICHDQYLPQGARLFNLSSHTHKHGKHFTVDLSDGSRIYESFVYNDPLDRTFDPPLAFDSPDRTDRRLHFCSFYNNGVAEDGSPDPNTVTRRSRIPESAQNTIGLCSPVACTAGQVGARCSGVNDDRTCDSALGANDGDCDACPITGGESTENEMFILIGSYFCDPAYPECDDFED